MPKRNAKGFYCFIDEEILNEWVSMVKSVNLSRSQAIEYFMALFLDRVSKKSLSDFKASVKEYIKDKKDSE